MGLRASLGMLGSSILSFRRTTGEQIALVMTKVRPVVRQKLISLEVLVTKLCLITLNTFSTKDVFSVIKPVGTSIAVRRC